MVDRTAARGLGIVVLLVSFWGGIVAYAGPSFGYAMGSGGAWTWTQSRATLHLAPAIAAAVGALVLLLARTRGAQLSGALLSMTAGVWFVLAPTLQPLWQGTATSGGQMMMGTSTMGGQGTSTTMQALQGIGYHYGTGALIAVLAACATGILAAGLLVEAGERPETEPVRQRRLRLRTHP